MKWLRDFTSDGDVILRLGRDGDQLIARWPGFAELRAHRSGAPFELLAEPGADPVFIEKFHTGLVRALIRHAQGKYTLHGACVARGGVAAVLLGETGDGKSSLAAEASRREGLALVADDTTQLNDDPRIATPTERVCWLRGDTDGRKVPHSVNAVADREVRLVAAIRLVWGDDAQPTLRRVRGGRAFQHVARALFRFVIDEPDVELRDFSFVARFAELVPVYELSRRRELAQLGLAADAVLGLLELQGTDR